MRGVGAVSGPPYGLSGNSCCSPSVGRISAAPSSSAWRRVIHLRVSCGLVGSLGDLSVVPVCGGRWTSLRGYACHRVVRWVGLFRKRIVGGSGGRNRCSSNVSALGKLSGLVGL